MSRKCYASITHKNIKIALKQLTPHIVHHMRTLAVSRIRLRASLWTRGTPTRSSFTPEDVMCNICGSNMFEYTSLHLQVVPFLMKDVPNSQRSSRLVQQFLDVSLYRLRACTRGIAAHWNSFTVAQKLREIPAEACLSAAQYKLGKFIIAYVCFQQNAKCNMKNEKEQPTSQNLRFQFNIRYV
jgi:hypothetical protein